MTYRKYWDNSDNEFKGATIKDSYIPYNRTWHLANGANSNSAACDSSGTNSLTFYARDSYGTLAGNTNSLAFTEFGSTNFNFVTDQIYVRGDASHSSSTTAIADMGKHPLVLVKDGPIIGEQPNVVIADSSISKYREVNSSSMAPTLSDCDINFGNYTFEFTDIDPDFGTGPGTTVADFNWNGPNLSTSDFTLSNVPSSLAMSVTGVNNNNNTLTISILPQGGTGTHTTIDLDFDSTYAITPSSDTDIDFMWGPCHVEGTLITMSNGKFKKVENLQIGDTLSSYKINGLSESGEWRNFKVNKLTKKTSSVKVVNIRKGTHTSYRDINNGLTKITGEHPVLVKHNNIIQFKQVSEISLGEFIYVNEKWTKVFSNEYVKKTSNTYSIDVEIDDVYIADGVLCHNLEESKTE